MKHLINYSAAFILVLTGCATGSRIPPSAPSEWAGDSASIQQALDAIAEQGGSVNLPAGRYRLDRAVIIPTGVTLAGTWQAPHYTKGAQGTLFEVYANKGQEDGPPLIALDASSAVSGITFYYPEQQLPDAIPYPWTIQGKGVHGSVMDCTFVNPYKAISFSAEHNELHYIRNCFGCPLKVGVRIDQCTDIGRIENVHFNPHYWRRSSFPAPDWSVLSGYLAENLVAFEFGRTDWEYVLNTFTFGAKVGYRFFKGDGKVHGTVNGNFLGIGADWCGRAMLVEDCQVPGLLITNGEFVGGDTTDAMIEILPSSRGVVQLSNCSFWGPCPQAAIVAGQGSASFSQCNFFNHGKKESAAYTVEARQGVLTVQACLFSVDRPDIHIGTDVLSAVIMGNTFKTSKEIENQSTGQVEQGLNVVVQTAPRQPSDPRP